MVKCVCLWAYISVPWLLMLLMTSFNTLWVLLGGAHVHPSFELTKSTRLESVAPAAVDFDIC